MERRRGEVVAAGNGLTGRLARTSDLRVEGLTTVVVHFGIGILDLGLEVRIRAGYQSLIVNSSRGFGGEHRHIC